MPEWMILVARVLLFALGLVLHAQGIDTGGGLMLGAMAVHPPAVRRLTGGTPPADKPTPLAPL